MGERQGVALHFINDKLEGEVAGAGREGGSSSLKDVYPHADLVTYPSAFEGFGNAFLEAIYYRKPILVNRYPVFLVDIEPKGFDLITIDGYLTDAVLAQVKEVLSNPERRQRMVERNVEIARKYFSFQILRKELAGLISGFFGIFPPKGLFSRLFR